MARNKYPEETIEKILDVSQKLFIEQGYDHTSIQDIIEHLGGLSKGAIYHHFKSKEDILLAVYKRISDSSSQEIKAIMQEKGITGAQKIRKMFLVSWKDDEQREFISSMPSLLKNPQFLAIHMENTMNEVVPEFILPIIEEGIQDKSITSQYPQELADVLMLLTNIWLNPLIYPVTEANIQKKIGFFNQLLTGLGFPLLEDGMGKHMQKVEKRMEELKEKQ